RREHTYARLTVPAARRADISNNDAKGNAMDDKHAPDSGRLVDSDAERLLRDLVAIGLLDVPRPSAAERLDRELGPDLLAAVRQDLGCSDSGETLKRGRPSRAA